MDKQQLSNLLHIQKASRENRLVIFVGAGVSANSGIPTWNKLVDTFKEELPDRLFQEADALKIAQLYKDSRGHKEYMDKVKSILLHNKVVPNPLHKSILSLNPCHIITTNYDDLLEQALLNEYLLYDIIREDKDIPQMTYPNALVKMHGDYSKDNIVLTESDYYNYKKNFPLIRAFVQSLFASKLVLFVGFSFSDLNLKMILNELQNILLENMQRAYLLSCDEPDCITKQYFEKKGINILYLSEKDIDTISEYPNEKSTLKNIGLQTDKILHAIKNYSATSKEELSEYVYGRIFSYFNELRSFGDGLRYFFPNNSEMCWNTHSNGLQTFLPYFTKLAKELKTKQAKRQYLSKHPNIDLHILVKIALYNYLYEIDGLRIIDSNILANREQYMKLPSLYFIHLFDSKKILQILKELRKKSIQYTIDDLELPYTLYVLGDYIEAYRHYVKLLPKYWNRQKYILYFICRYNILSIRNGVYRQKFYDEGYVIERELELASLASLETILSKLPIDSEIKNIFKDLISFRKIGEHVIDSEKLKEEIYKQRKSAEKGGCSINSNITKLMSLYQRESMFSWANYIVYDNNAHYKSICDNTALGILNSFATPSSTMFGGKMYSTKITALDAFMLELLIFEIDNKRLKDIIKGYEIDTLELDSSGIEYINSCLNGLNEKGQTMFVQDENLRNPLENLLYLISKSNDKAINTGILYRVLIKYISHYQNSQFDKQTIELIIKKYPAEETATKDLLWKILNCTKEKGQYTNCIFNLVKQLKKQSFTFNEFEFGKLQNKDKLTVEMGFLYPSLNEDSKEIVLDFCLNNFDCIYDYAYFIYQNNIYSNSINRFQELIEDTKQNGLHARLCHLLAQIRQCEKFKELHCYIDKLAESNDCISFFLSPVDFQNTEIVEVFWILEYDDEKRQELFSIPVYKEKLKAYITQSNLSKRSLECLLKFM